MAEVLGSSDALLVFSTPEVAALVSGTAATSWTAGELAVGVAGGYEMTDETPQLVWPVRPPRQQGNALVYVHARSCPDQLDILPC